MNRNVRRETAVQIWMVVRLSCILMRWMSRHSGSLIDLSTPTRIDWLQIVNGENADVIDASLANNSDDVLMKCTTESKNHDKSTTLVELRDEYVNSGLPISGD
uniref:Uncharacterized protein n=1 Tax=Oryza barthii TaxID=65489 RepID=A0A0D3G0J5_9ORYZ